LASVIYFQFPAVLSDFSCPSCDSAVRSACCVVYKLKILGTLSNVDGFGLIGWTAGILFVPSSTLLLKRADGAREPRIIFRLHSTKDTTDFHALFPRGRVSTGKSPPWTRFLYAQKICLRGYLYGGGEIFEKKSVPDNSAFY
ncbi:unnamed protein product, partial [Ectocarpus sp. 12 AP-2014]